jgi:predicted DNA-binding transcriptional regulator AlpA
VEVGETALARIEKAQIETLGPMAGDGYVSVPHLQKFLGGVSRATLYRWIKDELLPAPVQLGPNRVAFLRHEIREALAKRPRALSRKVSGAEDQGA